MMRRGLILLCACALWCAIIGVLKAKAQFSIDPEPGVARSLAEFRARHYRDVRYKLYFALAPNAERLTGAIEIRVTIDNPDEAMTIDWRAPMYMDKGATDFREMRPGGVSLLEANGKSALERVAFISDHIIIPREFLKAGENVFKISFSSPISASGSAVTRYRDREDGSEYIYTLFVPSDASTVFPCFDQPDLKARFQMEMLAPAAYKIVTNTEAEHSSLETPRSLVGVTMRRTLFHETEPISAYLFAFAAGEFAEFKDDASPFGTHLFVRKSKAERAKKESSEVFRINREGVRFYENYFAHKYPFPKYDLVLIPEFAYGGMEHAGATVMREDGILFPSDPTANDYLSRAEVILHEAAHQWFGDLVTMKWFDDLWLKEGFATFMAYKAMENAPPQTSVQTNVWKSFYQRTKPAAYLTDATKGTTPIYQDIPNLSAAKSAYGNIVYRKAPSFLRQAEFFLGADKFQNAVRLFVKEHAYSNATWSDLVNCFERTSNQKLDAWASDWVKRRGMPSIKVVRDVVQHGTLEVVRLEQTDALAEGGTWAEKLKVIILSDDGRREVKTVMIGKEPQSIAAYSRIGARRSSPAFIFANHEDYAYGRFLLDEESRDYALKNLGGVKDDFLRALLWGSLWDSVREAELAPVDYIELALRFAAQEQDEVTAQSVLLRVSSAYNRYLSDAQQKRIVPRLEEFLSKQMTDAPTVGLRITYFRAFQNVATTDAARETLKKILRDEIKISGMTLRTRDRFDIITALLARGDRDALQLLERQRTQDTTDDARRYAYAAAAAEPSIDVKRKYFDAYMNDKQVAESWIEASLAPFNAASQSDLTKPYLADALRLLPQLKRTRKIFFINNWLAAFLGGQHDADALRTVQDFLDNNPTLDRDLRLKILENVDGLERAVKIRAKYGTS